MAKTPVEIVFGVFSPPEILSSYEGPEFKNKVLRQLQQMFGYKKTRTTPYRPQGNSVSTRMHFTLHAILPMYTNIAQGNCAELLPFIHLAHNIKCDNVRNAILSKVCRQAWLTIYMIFGILHFGGHAETTAFYRSTRENLQLAFELARRNQGKKVKSKLLPIQEYTSVQTLLSYRPHHRTDGRGVDPLLFVENWHPWYTA